MSLHVFASHLQSDTSLQLHTTTPRAHGWCSHEMWYHERASVHFTIARRLRLKPGTSHDLCQSSPTLAPLNDFAHGGYAGVCLEETRNPEPATHERDRAAEERNARQRPINEAGDSVLGSQDSLVRRFHNLHMADTTAAQTAPPAPMPHSRRPTFLQRSLRTMASCCTWSRRWATAQGSVAQLRHLDRAGLCSL